jgi:hypothetical protein
MRRTLIPFTQTCNLCVQLQDERHIEILLFILTFMEGYSFAKDMSHTLPYIYMLYMLLLPFTALRFLNMNRFHNFSQSRKNTSIIQFLV